MRRLRQPPFIRLRQVKRRIAVLVVQKAAVAVVVIWCIRVFRLFAKSGRELFPVCLYRRCLLRSRPGRLLGPHLLRSCNTILFSDSLQRLLRRFIALIRRLFKPDQNLLQTVIHFFPVREFPRHLAKIPCKLILCSRAARLRLLIDFLNLTHI